MVTQREAGIFVADVAMNRASFVRCWRRTACPASLSALPTVTVTESDLKDEANSTCCVCIDDFEVGPVVERQKKQVGKQRADDQSATAKGVRSRPYRL